MTDWRGKSTAQRRRLSGTHALVRRHFAALLAVGLFWVPPVKAQSGAVYDPKYAYDPIIEEPSGLNRERWDALVFNTEGTGLPRNQETGVIARHVVPTIRICLQSPDMSRTGERLVPYSDAAWWRGQFERWTGLHWNGEIRIAACTESPSDGWIYVRDGVPGIYGRPATVGTHRADPEGQNQLGRWLWSEIIFSSDAVYDGELDQYFEEILAHELGHAMGFSHVVGAGYVMGAISLTTWPQEESDLAQLAYRVGPHVRYPGLVRRDLPLGDRGDRARLTTFYDATGGPNWRDNTRWGSPDAPLSLWYGVAADAAGRVLGVTLARNNLSGSLPTELGDLSSLVRLILGRNNLSGSLPPTLGDLSALQFLSFSDNDFSGAIPPTLGRLSNLLSLHLEGNNLSGPLPSTLGDLSRLKLLTLSGNNLTGPIPAELGDLSSLVALHLEGNNLSGEVPPEIGRLSRLTLLRLDGNNLTGPLPSSMMDLKNLRELHIRYNAGLCAPADNAFQAWLATLSSFFGPTCGAGYPDLEVGSATVSDSSPAAGAPFTLSVTVRNVGDGASEVVHMHYIRSADATINFGDDTRLGSVRVEGLAAGATSSESINLTAPTAGTHYYGACVNVATDESDPTNNCSTAVQVEVSEPVPVPALPFLKWVLDALFPW